MAVFETSFCFNTALQNFRVVRRPTFPSPNPANPGHYFACCGLFELASVLHPNTLAWFSGSGSNFHIAASNLSLKELLGKITSSEIRTLNAEDATASPLLIGAPFNLRLDWWKTAARATAALKVWAGTMECPRIARAMQNALAIAVRETDFLPENLLFDFRIAYAPQDTRSKVEPFYFDANRGPNAHSRDVGFAPNDLGLETIAAPATEFLCLVGLQRAIPRNASKPRQFLYHLWTRPLAVPLLAAAVNGLLPDSKEYRFRFESWFRTGQRKHKALLLSALKLLKAKSDKKNASDKDHENATLNLRRYILGLALVAFTRLSPGYYRQGTILVGVTDNKGEPLPLTIEEIFLNGKRAPAKITDQDALAYAKAAAAAFGVGQGKEVPFEAEKAKAAIAEAKKKKRN